MSRAALLTILFVHLGACRKSPVAGDTVRAADDVCAIPERAPDVVLGVSRHTVPVGGRARIEAGEVTVAGACSADIECVRVDSTTMARLVALVRGMNRVRHREPRVSPHYGSRFITIRWADQQCTYQDGVTAPIDPRDETTFSAVHEAIADAIRTSPEHVAPPTEGAQTR